jgi:Cys-tRNA(Pro)/Cys-tRNA(Cys) deacylase
VYLDLSALAHDRIAVSAGVRGVQIVLAPADYAKASDARGAVIARPKA